MADGIWPTHSIRATWTDTQYSPSDYRFYSAQYHGLDFGQAVCLFLYHSALAMDRESCPSVSKLLLSTPNCWVVIS